MVAFRAGCRISRSRLREVGRYADLARPFRRVRCTRLQNYDDATAMGRVLIVADSELRNALSPRKPASRSAESLERRPTG